MTFDPSFTKLKRNTLLAGILGSAAIFAAAVILIRHGSALVQGGGYASAMVVVTAALIALLFGSSLIGYLRARMELAARTDTEIKFRRALQRFETAIENTPDVAVQALDRNGSILLWNRASERIYGLTKGEAIGRDFAALVCQGPERQEFQRDLERIWAVRHPLPSRKERIRTKAGEEKHLLSTVFPILDGDTVVEVFRMGFDVSRETQARRELEQSLGDLQNLCQLMVGRESRVVELKKEINDLCDQMGVPRKYGV